MGRQLPFQLVEVFIIDISGNSRELFDRLVVQALNSSLLQHHQNGIENRLLDLSATIANATILEEPCVSIHACNSAFLWLCIRVDAIAPDDIFNESWGSCNGESR